ncbi:hypothetical protein LL973_09670 [Xanthomonas campestris pv. nigromaculans]|nr:hypothetical protein [Xanthomonas campestris pv. nigromaculans]
MVELDTSRIAGSCNGKIATGTLRCPDRKVEEATAMHLPGREGALLLANVPAEKAGETLENSRVATMRVVISFTS